VPASEAVDPSPEREVGELDLQSESSRLFMGVMTARLVLSLVCDGRFNPFIGCRVMELFLEVLCALPVLEPEGPL
jgi:hypothetical protein